jgi:adenosylcobyric acid synthase
VRGGGSALVDDGSAEGEGCVVGAVVGSSWHGLLEGDAVRRGLLAWVAARRGRRWLAGTEPFAAVRERHLDRLGALISENVDLGALEALIEGGAPAGLPVVESGLVGRVP